MTFAAVGTVINTGNQTTFSLTPAAVNDFILFQVNNVTGGSGPSIATSLSSTNVTWSTLGSSFTGTALLNWTTQCFIGKVTSTSTATVTIGWSGATPAGGNIQGAGQEFSTTAGFAAVTLDVQGHIDHLPSNVWPNLTPGHGAGELYWGWAADNGTAAGTNGTPTGYIYQADGQANAMAYNASCPNAATTPSWTDGGSEFGIAVLLYETGAAAPAAPQPRPPVIPQPRPRRRAVVITPPRPPVAGQLAAARPPVVPRPKPRGRAVVIPPRQLLASPVPPTPGRPVAQQIAPARPRPRGRAVVILPLRLLASPVPPAPGRPVLQPAVIPRPRPRGRAAVIRPGLLPPTPGRPVLQPAVIPRPRPRGRALVLRPGPLPPSPVPPAAGGGPPVFVDDGRPWLKRHRVKWHRRSSPLDWSYGEIPAGLAAAYQASGRVGDPGPDAYSEDAPAGQPAGHGVPDSGEQPDRRVRSRAKLRERIRGSDRPGRPVWSRDDVVPAASGTFDLERSERLVNVYRVPRPGWRGASEYPVSVVQRRK